MGVTWTPLATHLYFSCPTVCVKPVHTMKYEIQAAHMLSSSFVKPAKIKQNSDMFLFDFIYGTHMKVECTLGYLVGTVRVPYVIHLGPSKLARGGLHIKVFDTLVKCDAGVASGRMGPTWGPRPTIRRCTGESQAHCGAVHFFFKTARKHPVDTWVWCDWRLNHSYESTKNCKYETGKGTETKHNKFSTRYAYLFHCNYFEYHFPC